mmetsp:Transcript_51992/g.105929  ORF Transcript_51992/g.105929 Transcript_51992/m.105929 type:complete len:375 (-) Transcript_51992:134-1258(-)|eukprot:CAMPEP_0181322584 /NCGR_PEP_ID=MMETSP1101-20121128/19307_1 /TAXON_ID=46948 /ORGANISM="Rhodomonas abbreviata, Strain Caron Lab Isolate" /LENGTH=374 /DNA_ID=CAMNT_0023430509 /DNA_START=271 /DNA_END=1395 /DNA_ORIENTATION=-
MQSRSEAATKFTFNPATDSWHSEATRVVVERKPFAEGGMRFCLKLHELEENGDFIPCVAKIFKNDPGQKAYFDEALTQMTGECFAQAFNKYPLRANVAFLPVSVMVLDERKGQFCNVEPLMSGRYVKHNDNDGHVETKAMLPQTFSHFTWEASRHTLVVCDIQGVADCYTDPQIHSLDGSSFGQGNMGQSGILKFLRSHKCNKLCEMLGLPPMHRVVAERQLQERMMELSLDHPGSSGNERYDSPRTGGMKSDEEGSYHGSPKETPPWSPLPGASVKAGSGRRLVDRMSQSPVSSPMGALLSSRHYSQSPGPRERSPHAASGNGRCRGESMMEKLQAAKQNMARLQLEAESVAQSESSNRMPVYNPMAQAGRSR